MRLCHASILIAAALLAPAASPQPTRLGLFDSIELRNGGELVVRHGSAQRVSLTEGDGGSARLTVTGGRLVIDTCPRRCDHRRKARYAITVPALSSVSVAHGGTLRVEGPFPRQASLAAAVDQGGTVDIRAMQAAQVSAAVNQGGRILTRPLASLTGSVSNGGIVMYWGDPRVQPAVAGGGAIVRGEPVDADKLPAEIGPALAPLPALPRLPHPARPR